ncbi:unnamed protein product [Diatraea saccharalis]|uniref:FP protein C-terminal domain-containing protein n=1 Tax=Diatraea saccharalis TaxID=40085 RepID=A0A9N9QZU0_9NEOP|nr:unnamed protein product [Diatraea saccharalis]
MKQRRTGDNTNTSLCQPSTIQSVDEQSDKTCLNDNANVTLRNKSQRSQQVKLAGEGTPTGVSEERLRVIIRQELTEILKTNLKALVKEELSNIAQQLSGFHDSLTYFNGSFEDIKRDIEKITLTVKSLETDNIKLYATIADLSVRLSSLEQVSRESNIEINGIPERKSENLIGVVSQLTQSVGCSVAVDDILHVTRVAKLNRDNKRPRSIVAKLRSPRQRVSLLAAVSSYNRKNPKNKLNTTHFGLEEPGHPVFVSEHLTPANKSLHAAVRMKAKEMSYKFVWVRNGRICKKGRI